MDNHCEIIDFIELRVISEIRNICLRDDICKLKYFGEKSEYGNLDELTMAQ